MRGSQEYKALLAKINIQKEIYSQKDLYVNEELENKIQYYVEKIKKFNILVVISFSLSLVLLGIIYEFFKYYNIKQYIGYVVLIMITGLFVLIGFEIAYRKKLKNCNIKKDEEDKDKEKVREKIRDLNNLISSLTVSIITLNEHFYELSNITDDNLLKEKWHKYNNEIIMSIKKKYSYIVTYTEYQEYLKEYEESLQKKENKTYEF